MCCNSEDVEDIKSNFIIEEYGKALKKYEDKALQQSNSSLSEVKGNNEEFFSEFLIALRDIAYKYFLTVKDTNSYESESALLESQLWSLLAYLIESEQSDAKIEKNDKLNRLQYLKKWLESIISKPLRPLNLSKFSTNKTAFDKSVLEKSNESLFFQYCFELLLTGDFGNAIKECVSVNNFSLAMIISGYKVDETSNADNTLWRKTVKQLGDNTTLDTYERIIYKYLSGTVFDENDGDLVELIKKHYGWECHLLFYIKSIIDNEFESISSKFPQINIDLELTKALNLVFGQENTHHNIKDIMASLILDTENELFVSAKENLIKTFESDDITQFKTEKYLLRLLAHISIIIEIAKPGFIDQQSKNLFLSTYISSLRLSKLHSLIPSYIIFLNGAQRLVTYSNVLNDIVSVEDKEEQKLAALRLGLPYKDSLRRMAEDLFDQLNNDEINNQEIVSMNNTVTPTQKEMINCIDWLTIASLNNEAIDLLLAFFKNVLINGSIGAFRLIIEKVNISKLIAICQLDNRESDSIIINELLELNDCFKLLEEWHTMAKNINEVKNISIFAEKQKKLTEKLMHCVLNFFKDVTEDQNIHLYQIKVLYVPFFIIQLHKALDFASDVLGQKSLAEDALDLATIVAHEEKETYKLFQLSNKLEEYVRLATKTYIKLQDK
ncbi:hypothetical protein ACO0SA_001337 [Hanseniaspora valbyensis]